ncbi:predicted protein [Plenodomus lingam JN3]|uniref:Predicted protein n=1 Tax=Leptosphaeria maculans (strain JN3 / isolate v23.1.3 / race Av1-4-5-6-7-8) TaxID=985895 RepID=E5ABS3_LEPMJ|nr:predicted protein [Plenodomus lingam JN3]CBY01114.1 predicted protein [Plenodomus lingam JN3]
MPKNLHTSLPPTHPPLPHNPPTPTPHRSPRPRTDPAMPFKICPHDRKSPSEIEDRTKASDPQDLPLLFKVDQREG